MKRDRELYDRNRALFERDYPQIFERLAAITAPQSVLIGDVESGDVNIDLGHTQFYDTDAVTFAERQMAEFRRVPGQFFMNPPQRYDPPQFVHERVSEAMYAFWGEGELPKLPLNPAHDSGYLLVFGLGLGFHIGPLLEQCDVRYMVIMEEFLEFLDHSFWFQDWEALHARAAERDTKFFFLFGDDPDQVHSKMHWFMRGEGFGLIDGSYIFRHYRSMLLDQVYEQFKKELPLLPVSIGFWEDEYVMISNCSQNLIHHDSYLLDTTPRLERDVPAFIVGSGPSVDGSIDVIKQNRHKAVVFSCGTGLGALLKNGIFPDFHCELENVPGSYIHLQKLRDRYGPLDRITLIGSNTVHPKLLDIFDRPILFFRDSVSSTSLWAPDQVGIYGASPTVTNVGIRSALLLGFRQIYLFGVDLGTRDIAKRHSAQSIYETDKDWADSYEDRDRKWNIPMPANFGGKAHTNDILQWARMLMIHSLDPFPTAKIFNCSDGVKITGTIPKLPRIVKLDTPPSRVQQVIRQVKDSMQFIESPNSITVISIDEVVGEFESWASEVVALIDRSVADGVTFTGFYAGMVPLLRPAGERKYQRVIRSVYVGTLMMIFQIGYFFWHRTPNELQATMMGAFLTAVGDEFAKMAERTKYELEVVKLRLLWRRAGPFRFREFLADRIYLPAGGVRQGDDAALIRYLTAKAPTLDPTAAAEAVWDAFADASPFAAAVTAVILDAGTNSIVPDAELARVFDPARTPYLAFDQFENSNADSLFAVTPMTKSLDAVIAALRRLRPKLVYLRTTMETDFFAVMVRAVLPVGETLIIHELHDFAVAYDDQSLHRYFGIDGELAEISRRAECWTLWESRIVFSPRGGSGWNALFENDCGSTLLFPGIGAAAPDLDYRPVAGQAPRVLSLDASPERTRFGDRLHVTILDPASDVMNRDFVDLAADHEFGWLGFDPPDNGDVAKGWIIPPAFTRYIQAGLPVIVAGTWSLCAELVRQYGAGIVLSDGEGDASAAAQIIAADPLSLREGARRLHAYMLESNRRVLAPIADVIASFESI